MIQSRKPAPPRLSRCAHHPDFMKAPWHPVRSILVTRNSPPMRRVGVGLLANSRDRQRVETSNDPALARLAQNCREALGSLDRASDGCWSGSLGAERCARARPLISGCSDRRLADACSPVKRSPPRSRRGCRRFLRYVTLARFFCRKLSVQAGSLERTRNRQRRGGERRGCGFAG